MQTTNFTDLPSYLSLTSTPKIGDVTLFRGQSSSKPLLPKIARENPSVDTTPVEKQMLDELRRRGEMFLGNRDSDSWDLLVHAQHFGMATRLLDWTENPLVALWFSCTYAAQNSDSFVYVFSVKEKDMLSRKSGDDPFTRPNTKVFKPKLNNNRIIAQGGWFTAHKFSTSAKRFVPLELNSVLKNSITEVTIPKKLRPTLLAQLSILGVNHQTMFPDMEGLCRHINWLHNTAR